MKISHGIEYALVRGLAGLFRMLPHAAALKLGERLGRATDNVWTARHKVIIDNLIIAFGDEMTPAKRGELARDVFANIGMNMAEFARFPILDRERILSLATCDGEEALQEAIDFGKGAILVGSHFGNWELIGAYISALGFPVDFLARGQHNPLVDKYLTSLRKSGGVRVMHSERGGMKEVLRLLKSNRQVAIISDQHAGSQGIIVSFFGRRVSVPRAPATLSARTGAPIIYGQISRNPDNTHHCHFDAPIYPDLTADTNDEIFRLTKLYTRRIEEAIRSHPAQWLWTHRRFKFVPRPEQSEGSFVE